MMTNTQKKTTNQQQDKENAKNSPRNYFTKKKRKTAQQKAHIKQTQQPEELCREYIDGWKRATADFENYKKRQAEERKHIVQFAKEEFIQDLLPVIDNFEEAYKHKPVELEDHSWVKGIEYIKKQFESFLEQLDVHPIPTKGEEFQEQYHEAVQSKKAQPSKQKITKHTKMMIIKEVRKGYTLHESVIRPARVIVSIEE